MRKYRSHKIVHAAKIERVLVVGRTHRPSPHKILLDNQTAIFVGSDWLSRFKPYTRSVTDYKLSEYNDLGYFVRYKDGYESWSPSKAFEDGYDLIEPTPDDAAFRLSESEVKEIVDKALEQLPPRESFPDCADAKREADAQMREELSELRVKVITNENMIRLNHEQIAELRKEIKSNITRIESNAEAINEVRDFVEDPDADRLVPTRASERLAVIRRDLVDFAGMVEMEMRTLYPNGTGDVSADDALEAIRQASSTIGRIVHSQLNFRPAIRLACHAAILTLIYSADAADNPSQRAKAAIRKHEETRNDRAADERSADEQRSAGAPNTGFDDSST